MTAAVVLSCALGLAAAAGAATGSAGTRAEPSPIAYGVADDTPKYSDDGGASFYGRMSGAGLTENRWTLAWDASHPAAIAELPFLERAAPVAQAAGIHIVLSLYSKKAAQHDPVGFCTWAARVVTTVEQWGITDFIVWNEPNTRLYWVPQQGAGAAYERLLATCYDAIKTANPDAHVIGMGLSSRASTAKSTEPLVFLRQVGRAYRRSGRTTPIMDQLAIHPYANPNSPTDSPDVGYPDPSRYGIPNLDRVKQAVYDAFNGTGQPTTISPLAPLTFRIDEIGWQVDTTRLAGYVHLENVRTVSQPTQSRYLARMVQTYFACDPTVADVLLFLLVDEKYRNGRDETNKVVGGGWQSGLIEVDGTEREAYATMDVLATAGRDACTGALITWKPAGANSRTPGAPKRRPQLPLGGGR
ncbi:MAG: hypothetical protein ABR569_06825 [Gaiellaceae bacterium]